MAPGNGFSKTYGGEWGFLHNSNEFKYQLWLNYVEYHDQYRKKYS